MNIKELENKCLKPILYSVYGNSLCGDTLQDLLSNMIAYINEVITQTNDTTKLVNGLYDYVKNQGLKEEVIKQLNIMVDNGTFENIINQEVFGDLDNRVNTIDNGLNGVKTKLDEETNNRINGDIENANLIKSERQERIEGINKLQGIIDVKLSGIYLDDNEGANDFEKLQNAINKVIKGDNRNIILDRKVEIPQGKTLMINREVSGSYFGDNHLGHQINIYGIGNGGIIKRDNGFMFDSEDINSTPNESILTYTGQVALYNMYIEGNKDNILINGDRVLRFTVQNCDINKIRIIKSEKYTQSIYILNNRIRWWNDVCLDTNNNYDLTVKNNLFEFGQSFWTFKGANGVRICDNLIEGLTGYVVKAKISSGCHGLIIEGNYVEGNKEYFDFTELKPSGMRVSGTFSHTTGNPKPVIFYLPVNAHGTGSHLDECVFSGNSDTGNSIMFKFNSKPSDLVKIISIGDRGGLENNDYIDNITFVGRTLSVNGTVSQFKKYKRGDVTVIYGNQQQDITLANETKVHVIEVDTGFILSETDLVSIQYNAGGGHYDEQLQIANINICSHIIKNNSTKLKVIIAPTGNYIGAVTVNLKISILKTPYTQYF